MAVDEAVFIRSRFASSLPTVRFYGWLGPSVSIGYFQQIEDVIDVSACLADGITLVRRPTGGKAVFHEHDLTYAVVGRERDGFPSGILETYRLLSRCLIRGLKYLGLDVQMAEESRLLPPSQALCFSAPSRYELLVKGRKICGSAQLRSRDAFLQHGSLLLDFDPGRTAGVLLTGRQEKGEKIERLRRYVTSLVEECPSLPDMETLCSIMKRSFEKELGIVFEPGELTPEEELLKGQLMEDKYTKDEWNMKGGASKNGFAKTD